MDGSQFDGLTRSIARSRRSLLSGALALAGGWVGIANAAAGKQRRKKKKSKKPKLNAYGCLDVGQPCDGNSAKCCSGICEGSKPKKGKPDKSHCVSHDTADVCFPDNDTCTIGANVPCNADNSSCLCVLTTGNAGFCGDFGFTGGPDSVCRDCSKDADCQDEFGPGAACVVLKGICSAACAATGRTACIAVCPDAEI